MSEPNGMREALDRRAEELANQRDSLSQQREQLIVAMTGENNDDEHDPEGATLAWERESLGALIEQTRIQQEAVRQALQRLDEGWEGACERCGQPIPAARLAARPQATRCVPCASERGPKG